MIIDIQNKYSSIEECYIRYCDYKKMNLMSLNDAYSSYRRHKYIYKKLNITSIVSLQKASRNLFCPEILPLLSTSFINTNSFINFSNVVIITTEIRQKSYKEEEFEEKS